ncbi:MAG: 16S rRNA (cytosine(1402)-N(4))-methyltransferase RsmH [Bacteroidota bacterium]|nr:16S rRNA (cytosine(1402)-N(4))-methyltransferase RsmH [Bacteroidota bacterium]
MVYHKPVLLQEVIEGLNLCDTGTYADLTFGGGGHSKEILKKLTTGILYAFDQDLTAHKNHIKSDNLKLIHANFRDFQSFLRMQNIQKLNGIFADLGVSSYQIDNSERGFSFRLNGALDMRMNINGENNAYEVVNKYPQEELQDIFYNYGELTNAKQIARVIVKSRMKKAIITTQDLVDVVIPFTKGKNSNKFLARIFQAIRISVNNEMECLKEMLLQATDILKDGGRLAVISYHSLEDRLVKNLIKYGNIEGVQEKDFYGNRKKKFKQINKKIIVPKNEELKQNPRARSAKLRIAERICNE